MKLTANVAIIKALAKRDLRLYFASPTGYVFITLFIFLSAAAAFWQDRFFLQNLATLDALNGVFPYLLLFFIPALTMGVWSEERKQGTDELLLTLPATDFEIVLGKYLAVLGIFTVSLVLSLSHVVVLFFLGSPDLGLMAANYAGYWLVGGALIAVGMLASLLSRNATISFVVGAAFCAVLIVTGGAVGTFSPGAGRLVEPLGVYLHFQDFAKGIASLTGFFYFVSVTVFFLYVNVMALSRRHWPSKADGYPMWTHQTVRAIAIAVALVSVGAMLTRASVRIDVTAERLHSLSDETRALIAALPTDRPVFIQAYVSPMVPEPLVQTRADLISLLQEIDALAGPRVEVLIQDTEPFTDAAREARDTFGILPRQMLDAGSSRSEVQEVFLGLAFTCGAEEQVIGFFDRGLPAEYEIVRSIRVVAGTERKRIGIVKTMINLVGGVNFTQNEFAPQWSVVEELRKQYEVYDVDPDYPLSQDMDAVLVPLPSSLQTDQMLNIAEYIQSGKPALILVDPLPTVNPTLSPTEWVGDGNPYTYPPGTPRPGPRGNVRRWLMELGVEWEPTRVVWDAYNPHPELAHMPEEVIFLGAGNGNEATFSSDDPITRDLQEVVLLYSGSLDGASDPAVSFEPLLRTGAISGLNGYFTLVGQSPFGPQMNPDPPRSQTDEDYVIAARFRSGAAVAASEGATEGEGERAADDADDDEADETDAADEPGPLATGVIDMIVIADLDFVSEQFFAIREQGPGNLSFDNVTFFLNAMDTLVGDDSFIALRSRRARHRTLEVVEAQTAEFIEQRTADEQRAELDAEAALTAAQARLDERVAEIETRTDLDAQAREIMVRNLEEVENRRLNVLSASIETEKETKIRASRETMERQIRQIQTSIRTGAILLPPIPVFVLGVWIFIRRRRREREGAAAAHRLRG
jgi:ABC-2 type transport system permease protein